MVGPVLVVSIKLNLVEVINLHVQGLVDLPDGPRQSLEGLDDAVLLQGAAEHVAAEAVLLLESGDEGVEVDLRHLAVEDAKLMLEGEHVVAVTSLAEAEDEVDGLRNANDPRWTI